MVWMLDERGTMNIRFLVKWFVLPMTFWLSACEADWVDIGGRRNMYIECEGTGSPTVVFISGRTDRGDIWKKADQGVSSVFSAVSKFTHACIYDRPGTVTIVDEDVEVSRSTEIMQPITPQESVADLHALLKAGKVPGPYLLVAHSYGGLIARTYASVYPNEVVGLVLVDTLTEYLYDVLDSKQQEIWVKLNSNYSPELDKFLVQEKTDLKKSFEQMRASKGLRSIPALVITSDKPYDFKTLISEGVLPEDAPIDLGGVFFEAHLKGQEKLAKVLNAKQITKTHAGHYIQNEQPRIVVDAVRDVVEKVRGGKPSCGLLK